MKSFIALLLLTGATAQANVIYPLVVPADVPKGNQPSGRTCVATSFNANDTSNGTCRSVTASVCSGRACQPTYTSTVFAVMWDTQGNPLSSVFCGTFVSHQTLVHQWTYQPGFTSATCYLPAAGSTQILVYDPTLGFEHWYGYIATSADGEYELLTYGPVGYINQLP